MSAGIILADDYTESAYQCDCGGMTFNVLYTREGKQVLCCVRCSCYHPKMQIMQVEGDEVLRTPS